MTKTLPTHKPRPMIDREILVGELADPKQATLPIVAAIGGMVIPVLIYISINPEGHTLDG